MRDGIMRYLFIDTSTNDLTIAISSVDKVHSLMTSKNNKEHSKYALLELQKAFNEAGLNPNDIDKILVVNGPGSFTGIRIGVTIAKTYAWALRKDIIPLSSLQTYALGYDNYDYYVSVLDARRNYVYAAIYDRNHDNVLEEQYISIDKLYQIISKLEGHVIVIGDININEYKNMPIKMDILKTIKYFENINPVLAHNLNPHYLKRVEAEEKLFGETQ